MAPRAALARREIQGIWLLTGPGQERREVAGPCPRPWQCQGCLQHSRIPVPGDWQCQGGCGRRDFIPGSLSLSLAAAPSQGPCPRIPPKALWALQHQELFPNLLLARLQDPWGVNPDPSLSLGLALAARISFQTRGRRTMPGEALPVQRRRLWRTQGCSSASRTSQGVSGCPAFLLSPNPKKSGKNLKVPEPWPGCHCHQGHCPELSPPVPHCCSHPSRSSLFLPKSAPQSSQTSLEPSTTRSRALTSSFPLLPAPSQGQAQLRFPASSASGWESSTSFSFLESLITQRGSLGRKESLSPWMNLELHPLVKSGSGKEPQGEMPKISCTEPHLPELSMAWCYFSST